jgi:hypothetical protein
MVTLSRLAAAAVVITTFPSRAAHAEPPPATEAPEPEPESEPPPRPPPPTEEEARQLGEQQEANYAGVRRRSDEVRSDVRALEEAVRRRDRVRASRGFVPLPVVQVGPEIGLQLGVFGMYYWHIGDVDRSRSSNVRAVAAYTTKAQGFVEVGPDIWLDNNAAHLFLVVGYGDAPYKYFGRGNVTRESASEDFTERSTYVVPLAQVQVVRNLFVGGRYRLEWRDIRDRNGPLLQQPIPGSQGGVVSGGGPVVTFDDRDGVYAPTRGTFLELGYANHPSFLGSDYAFGQLNVDARRYFRVTGESVLAFQLRVTLAHGDAPFYSLPQIGGRALRGIFLGRYRENHMMEGQVEYRFPIFWRLGGAAFLGAGDVGRTVGSLFTNRLHPAGGMGLRYALVPDERLNVRFDVGYGDDVAYYLDISEAF